MNSGALTVVHGTAAQVIVETKIDGRDTQVLPPFLVSGGTLKVYAITAMRSAISFRL